VTKSIRNLTLHDALRHILSEQYAIMVDTVPGVLADDDPEPLHDLRVASRRSRTALSRLRPAIDPDQGNALRDIYRDLVRTTNRMRDLDVYVDVFSNYFNLVPPAMHPELRRYLKRLRERRNRESHKIAATLTSEPFQNQLARLDIAIHGDPGLLPGPRAGAPALPYACRKILKRYHQVITIGAGLDETAPDTEFHQLRIRCKKLRYMMEFFRNYFPKNQVENLIRQMKSLQTLLGDFNDLSVQIRILDSDLTRGRNIDTRTAAMLGGLIVALRGRKDALRKRFHSTFDTFSRPKTESTFQKIYGI